MNTRYREGRLVVLVNMAFLLLGWVAFGVLPVEISAADLIVAAAFALASALTIWAVPAVIRHTLQPIPPDADEAEARRLSHGRFMPAVGFGAAAGSLIPYWACVAGIMADSPATYAVPFIIGEILLYRYVLPRPAMVAAATRRLEAAGATSYLGQILAGRQGPPNASPDAP